jgi:D-alanyl-lipoteichoic acid acyltransferase DltB (MBOAT superfamily)
VLFNSLAFLVFFSIVFALYLLLPRRAQNLWLLAASLFFYGAWDWRFLGLIFAATAIHYACGLALARSDDPRRRRAVIATSVVASLGMLGVFKYADFFAESLRALLLRLGVPVSEFALHVVLPVGISFYTFQTMSYAIDVYRRHLEPTRDFLDFFLFVSFFPQLVAGPIERATNLLPQIQQERRVTLEKVAGGSWLFLWGLFKKVVIADNLWPLVDAVYAQGARPTGAEVLMASYAFGLLAYCDFSGYSDIARGTARMLGFELMLNFDLPYFTRSLQEFWRRWHISLSSWLRDYLYIPLGGNRRRGSLNLWLTMVLCGLWHGAGWNYVAFGAYHGSIMVLYLWTARWRGRWLSFEGARARRAWAIASVVITFHVVTLGWPIFRAETIGRTFELFAALASDPRLGLVLEWAPRFALLALPLALMSAAQIATGDLEVVHRAPWPARAALYAAAIAAIVLFGEDFGEDFIYFRF